MKGIAPSLVHTLARLRIEAGRAVAAHGVGERRSRARGEGIEFEDHRPYAPGDDMRRIDPHVYIRLGKPYVRQFNVSQRLDVTIVVDASASMGFGTPSKLEVARSIALSLAYVALSGLDVVNVGVWQGSSLAWQRGLSGARQLEATADWIHRYEAEGATDGGSLESQLTPFTRANGLLILISDLWMEAAESRLRSLLGRWGSGIVLHVLAPEERDPAHLGAAPLRLVDSESGDEVEVVIGEAEAAQFHHLLSHHIEALRSGVVKAGDRYVLVDSSVDLVVLLTNTFRREGVFR